MSRPRAAAAVAVATLITLTTFASPAAASTSDPDTYTVHRGDALSTIASRSCGSAGAWRELYAGNRRVIGSNPNLIFPGQRLRLTCPSNATSRPAQQRATRSSTRISVSGWVNPLAGAAVTSCFGPRWGTMHRGVDLAKRTGAPIRAAHAGTVTRAGWVWSGYGISVVISNGGGIWTHYAHMSREVVHPGQRVAAGQVIGYVGQTGDTTGPHLHFEVARSSSVLGSRIPPAAFMRAHGAGKVGC